MEEDDDNEEEEDADDDEEDEVKRMRGMRRRSRMGRVRVRRRTMITKFVGKFVVGQR